MAKALYGRANAIVSIMAETGASATAFTSEDEWTPIAEAVVAEDGTIPIRIVSPGWSKNRRYYSEGVLQKAAPLYRSGTHCYWNHPGPTSLKEHPSGDLNALAAVLVEDGVYRNDEKYGPGIYTRVKPLAPYRERIGELLEISAADPAHPVIGISHRIRGRFRVGEVDGKRGKIVEEIFDPFADPTTPAITVDFVTRPAAGGIFAEAEEDGTMTGTNADDITEQIATAVEAAEAPLKAEVAARDTTIATLKEEAEVKDATIADLKTKGILARAKELLTELLGESDLADPAKKRVAAVTAVAEPAITEDFAFDEEAYKKVVATAIAEEIEYVKSVGGSKGHGVKGGDGVDDYLEDVRELRRTTGRTRR